MKKGRLQSAFSRVCYDEQSQTTLIVAKSIEEYKDFVMSKINYIFVPIPRYFWDTKFLNPQDGLIYFKRLSFITWAFSKCSTESRIIYHDNCKLILEPYEFICGRHSLSEELCMTEKEIRGQLEGQLKSGNLKKGANSRANRFSTYIWVTSQFEKHKGQLEGQPRANRGPTEGPQTRSKEERQQEHVCSLGAGSPDKKLVTFPREDRTIASETYENIQKAFEFETIEEAFALVTEAKKSNSVLYANSTVIGYLQGAKTNLENKQKKEKKHVRNKRSPSFREAEQRPLQNSCRRGVD